MSSFSPRALCAAAGLVLALTPSLVAGAPGIAAPSDRATSGATIDLIPAPPRHNEFNDINDVAAGVDGRFAVAWRQFWDVRSGMRVREGTRANKWSDTKIFDRGTPVSVGRLATARDGTWVLAWMSISRRSKKDSSIRVATKAPGRGWSRPRTLVPVTGRPTLFDLVEDGDGNVVLLYSSEDRRTYIAELTSVTRSADGQWTHHPRLAMGQSSGNFEESAVPLAGGSFGHVEVLDNQFATVYEWAPNGVWVQTANFDLSATAGLTDVSLVAGPNGSPTMFWSTSDTGVTLHYRDRVDGAWSAASTIPGTPSGDVGLRDNQRIYVGGDGSLVITWVDASGAHWLQRSATGEWRAPETFASRRAEASGTARLTDGRWVVTYREGRVYRSRIRTPTGVWEPAKTIVRMSGGGAYPSTKGGYLLLRNHDYMSKATMYR